jgi:hypothetical protein
MPRLRSLCVAALVLAACNHDAPDRPTKDPPPRPPALSASDSASPGSAPAPPPPASASAADPGGAPAIAGAWEGAYDAKKGTVDLPAKVKDKGLAGDDGKAASGPGKIEITILPGGDVRGKGSGALGASTLTGRAEGGMLRATLMPDDPRAPNAMTGVLIGMVKGDAIHAEIHVAGPDGTVVREAQLDLKKK